MQCTDESNYVGDYTRGKRNGHGVYTFPNGDKYAGERDVRRGCGRTRVAYGSGAGAV